MRKCFRNEFILTSFVFLSLLCDGNSSRGPGAQPELFHKRLNINGVRFRRPLEVRKRVVGPMAHTGSCFEPLVSPLEIVCGCQRVGGQRSRGPGTEMETFFCDFTCAELYFTYPRACCHFSRDDFAQPDTALKLFCKHGFKLRAPMYFRNRVHGRWGPGGNVYQNMWHSRTFVGPCPRMFGNMFGWPRTEAESFSQRLWPKRNVTGAWPLVRGKEFGVPSARRMCCSNGSNTIGSRSKHVHGCVEQLAGASAHAEMFPRWFEIDRIRLAQVHGLAENVSLPQGLAEHDVDMF